MPRHQVSASARLDAPAAAVYGIIADYTRHHPRILPPAFSNLTVRQGGVGAGTVITFDLRVLGQIRHYEGFVTEPEPGRYLVESYPAQGGATSFRVEPDGNSCTLTIATEFDVRSGPLGALERWMAGALLRPIYGQELRLIAEYAATHP
jgi:hypothetical protein